MIVESDEGAEDLVAVSCHSPASGSGDFCDQTSNMKTLYETSYSIGLTPTFNRVAIVPPQQSSQIAVGVAQNAFLPAR